MTGTGWDEVDALASAVADRVARILEGAREPDELDVLASAVAARLTGPATVTASAVADAVLDRGGPGTDTRRAPLAAGLAGIDPASVAALVLERVAAVETGSARDDAARVLASTIAARLTAPVLVATPGELDDFAEHVGAAVAAHLDARAGTLPREDVDVDALLGSAVTAATADD